LAHFLIRCRTSGLHHPQIPPPRPHRFLILFRHHPADLVLVREVVRHPSGQQLPERHRPELGVLALKLQLSFDRLPPRMTVTSRP
jgi:hypothetical protein